MKTAKQFLLIISCMLCLTEVLGQGFLNKVGKKILEKTNTSSPEKEVKDSIKSPENAPAGEPSSQANPMGNLLGKMGIASEPGKLEDAYAFDLSVHMLIENYRGDKKESERAFVYYFDQNAKNLAFEPGPGTGKDQVQGSFIIDVKNNSMIMLSEKDGKKSAMVFRQNFSDLANPENQDEANVEGSFTKTGRSKTILGYKCDEYRYDDAKEKNESFFWITPEVDLKLFGMGEAPTKKSALPKNIPAGFTMEYVITNTRNNDRTVMTVTDIDKNISKQINMKAYEVQQIGGAMNPN